MRKREEEGSFFSPPINSHLQPTQTNNQQRIPKPVADEPTPPSPGPSKQEQRGDADATQHNMAPPEGATLIRYRSLDRSANEIRLLELQPAATGDLGERLVCRLVHARLSDSPEFVGLSALWGNLEVTEPVFVNGARVAVPADIAEALRYMRAVFLAPTPTPQHPPVPASPTRPAPAPPLQPPPKKPPGWLRSLLRGVKDMFADAPKPGSSRPPLRIWIDLLCVNMRNAREESERRAHMALAYRHAKMVVGWLGPKDATSDLAVEIIKAWDKCMPASFGEPGDREAHPENYAPILQWMGPVAHYSEIPEGVTDARDVPSYRAISGFLNRPYFRNAWILDDMAKARFPAFLLGDDIVSWMQVLRLNRVNEDIRDHGAEMFPDELRPLLEYMPLGTVYTFLKEFDARQKQDGVSPMTMLTNTTSSIRSSASTTGLRGTPKQ